MKAYTLISFKFPSLFTISMFKALFWILHIFTHAENYHIFKMPEQ